MVRMDVCVEALYDKSGMSQRGKAMQMLKVMKGAISVSKSRTGECIFKSNKLERRNLDRLVRCYKKDCDYISAKYDSQKKVTTQRFMKLLDRQNSFNCQEMLGDILETKTTDDRTNSPDGTGQDPLLKLLDLRLQRPEAGVSGFGLQKGGTKKTQDEDGDQQHVKEEDKQEDFVTEKQDIRSKYTAGVPVKANKKPASPAPMEKRTTVHGVVLGQTIAAASNLPSIHSDGKSRSLRGAHKDESGDYRKTDDSLPDRDLTNWQDWRLKDKDCFLDYIYRQKTRQEDLLMRNALMRIRSDMMDGNSIKGYRVRQQLQTETMADSDLKPKGKMRRETPMPPIVIRQATQETLLKKSTYGQTTSDHEKHSRIKESQEKPSQPVFFTKSILKVDSEKTVTAEPMGRARSVRCHKSVSLPETSHHQKNPSNLGVILENQTMEGRRCRGGQLEVVHPTN